MNLFELFFSGNIHLLLRLKVRKDSLFSKAILLMNFTGTVIATGMVYILSLFLNKYIAMLAVSLVAITTLFFPLSRRLLDYLNAENKSHYTDTIIEKSALDVHSKPFLSYLHLVLSLISIILLIKEFW